MTGEEHTAVPSIANPAYWGSLGALVAAIGWMTIAAALNGPDPTLVEVPQEYDDSIVYGAGVVVVLLFVIRYYAAVAVHWADASDPLGRFLPPPIRKVAFGTLSALIFFAGMATLVLSSFGVLEALAICMLMALLSFSYVLTIWAFRVSYRKNDGRRPTFALGFGEIFVLCLIGYLLGAFTVGIGTSEDLQGVEVGLVLGMLLFFFGHELLSVHLGRISDQLTMLRRELQAAPSGDDSNTTETERRLEVRRSEDAGVEV